MYDTMQYIRPQVQTVCIGQAASAGSLLLMAGAAGKRFALPNSKIMIHQPSGGFQGQVTDIQIHAEEIMRTRQRLNELYRSEEHTSELQSLMRTSYAVFCLKHKNKKQIIKE